MEPASIPRHWFAQNRLKLRHLRVLIAVAAARHIGQAARDLHLSQPAVSKALQELELAAGMTLFERRADGSYPTAAGIALVRYAHEVFGTLERAGQEMESLSRGLAGTLAIGCNFPAAVYLVPRAVLALAQANPLLSVSIREAPLEVLLPELRTRHLDVVVARWPRGPDSADLQHHGSFAQPMAVACAPTHPLANKPRVAWKDLANCRWILPPRGSAVRGELDELLRLKGIEPKAAAIESSSVHANTLLLRELEAVTLVPLAVARHMSGRDGFALLPVRMPPSAFSRSSAITLRGHELTPAVLSLFESLEAVGEVA